MIAKDALRGFDIFIKNQKVYLICSALPAKKFLALQHSADGIRFSSEHKRFELVSALGLPENPHTIGDMTVTTLSSEKYFLTYTKKNKERRTRLYGATSSSARRFKKIGAFANIYAFGMVVPKYHFEKRSVLYFGERAIKIAFSADMRKWDIFPVCVLSARKNYFDHSTVRVARLFLSSEGITLFYLTKNARGKLCLGGALFDKNAPGKLLWRSGHPLWEQPADWQTHKIRFVGIICLNKKFIAYFQEGEGDILAFRLGSINHKTPQFLNHRPTKKRFITMTPVLTRARTNPLLKPQPENSWEATATFNPAAVCIDGIVHLLYRAQGHDGFSVLGYASSTDGIRIQTRSKEPVYVPSQPFEQETKDGIPLPAYPYTSGGGWGGCEDPRLSKIGNTLYMTYVAFNGHHPPGVALTSIPIEDFLTQRWHWKKPRLISKPGQIQKNWVIFPEKINGKYAILHSISPSILIDYVDSLDDPELTIESYHNNASDNNRWDNIMRGVGAPPIRTDHGWLVLYHAMDRRDPNKYKVGAMLLDYQNPQKILYRSSQPILEPVAKYENEGFKSGVIYVCGAVIKNEMLFIYYGGADTFVAVASAPLAQFMDQLCAHEAITLTPMPSNVSAN